MRSSPWHFLPSGFLLLDQSVTCAARRQATDLLSLRAVRGIMHNPPAAWGGASVLAGCPPSRRRANGKPPGPAARRGSACTSALDRLGCDDRQSHSCSALRGSSGSYVCAVERRNLRGHHVLHVHDASVVPRHGRRSGLAFLCSYPVLSCPSVVLRAASRWEGLVAFLSVSTMALSMARTELRV